jgi:hypothetical protein
MKRAIGFSFLFLAALSLIQILSPRLEAQNRTWSEANQPRDGVCFYTDSNYRGANFCVSSNESSRNVGPRYNDRISSIRIFGRAQVTVYDNESFNGSRSTFSQDMPNLGVWNDRITSFESAGERQSEGRYEGQSRGQFGGRGRGNEPRNGVCFYRDANYRGERFCVNSDESLGNIGERYNDRISSIRIFGRAEVTVYENEGFNGSRQTFSRDMPNLGNWSDRITSFQVTGGRQSEGQYRRESERPYGVRRNGGEPRNGACFYKDADYRGDSFCLNVGESLRNVEDRFNDGISSIQVFGRSRVVVHEHTNFGGARRNFTGDVSNLAGDFNDIISSIEVR